MIPPMSRYLVEKYSHENDIVLDPFCGSGTTLLEAYLLRRNAVGIDINPLASLISKVKTTPIDVNRLAYATNLVAERLRTSDAKMAVDFPNIDYWFCEKSKNELARIKTCIENLIGGFDEDIQRFMLVCFSSIVRKSSNADPHMAKTYRSKRVLRKIAKGWVPSPMQYFKEAIGRNLQRIELTFKDEDKKAHFVNVFDGDARETSTILRHNGVDEVDLIVTSPPYINAQDYFRSYKLELWWLGLATPEEVRILNRRAIGTEHIGTFDNNSIPSSENRLLDAAIRKIWRRKDPVRRKKARIIYSYFAKMETVFDELHGILKPDRFFCIVTGNNTICETPIPTYKILAQMAKDHGFRFLEVYKDEIRNRSLFLDRNHNGGVIKEEWITVFQNK
jgi:DNA modification methylase